jgi:glycosyltransferase involved in cell wall biosynthesis
MNWKRECAVIIPCLNEAVAIGAVITGARKFLPSTFVVDDGSTDGTTSVAESAGAKVLSHTRSRGKGTALQTGWQHACDAGFKWALTMDGDGQHAPEDIPKFLTRAEKTSADLVIGNRMESPDKMPPVRRLVNRWMSARISNLAGCPLPDSQCGFRLINLDALAATQIYAAHFEIESEVLVRFATARHGIEFVPIQVIYKGERSKIHPLRDSLRWFRWWRKMQRVAKSRRKPSQFPANARPPITVP